jgi:hypothetical protein
MWQLLKLLEIEVLLPLDRRWLKLPADGMRRALTCAV